MTTKPTACPPPRPPDAHAGRQRLRRDALYVRRVRRLARLWRRAVLRSSHPVLGLLPGVLPDSPVRGGAITRGAVCARGGARRVYQRPGAGGGARRGGRRGRALARVGAGGRERRGRWALTARAGLGQDVWPVRALRARVVSAAHADVAARHAAAWGRVGGQHEERQRRGGEHRRRTAGSGFGRGACTFGRGTYVGIRGHSWAYVGICGHVVGLKQACAGTANGGPATAAFASAAQRPAAAHITSVKRAPLFWARRAYQQQNNSINSTSRITQRLCAPAAQHLPRAHVDCSTSRHETRQERRLIKY